MCLSGRINHAGCKAIGAKPSNIGEDVTWSTAGELALGPFGREKNQDAQSTASDHLQFNDLCRVLIGVAVSTNETELSDHLHLERCWKGVVKR